MHIWQDHIKSLGITMLLYGCGAPPQSSDDLDAFYSQPTPSQPFEPSEHLK